MRTASVSDLNTEALARLGSRIDAAWKRVQAGKDEWVEGSLELMQALGEARQRFTANQAFSAWLENNGHDHINKNDQAALINMADDLTLARDVLTKTDRRSYQHIWHEVQSRFPHVRKTPRRKGAGKGRRHKPRDAKEKDAASKMLDEGKSRTEAAAEAGLTEHVVQLSMERELGRREEREQMLGAAAAQNFTDSGRLRIEEAIRIHKARLDRAFEQVVNEEVRRRIAAADDATRKNNTKLMHENLQLGQMLNQRGVFTESEYGKLLMCVHPDNSASIDIRNEMLQLLVANKRRLVRS